MADRGTLTFFYRREPIKWRPFVQEVGKLLDDLGYSPYTSKQHPLPFDELYHQPLGIAHQGYDEALTKFERGAVHIVRCYQKTDRLSAHCMGMCDEGMLENMHLIQIEFSWLVLLPCAIHNHIPHVYSIHDVIKAYHLLKDIFVRFGFDRAVGSDMADYCTYGDQWDDRVFRFSRVEEQRLIGFLEDRRDARFDHATQYSETADEHCHRYVPPLGSAAATGEDYA